MIICIVNHIENHRRLRWGQFFVGSVLVGLLANGYADNWRASFISSVQLDNRFRPERQFSAQGQLNLAYDNPQQKIQGRVNALFRTSELFYQRGEALYELSVQKELPVYHSRLTAGRVQRFDNLGFYFLDGLQWNYADSKNNWSLEMYAGKPGRIDDVQSIQGDYLYGMQWKANLISLPLDKESTHREWFPLKTTRLDLRMGVQRLKDQYRSDRFNLAINHEGRSWDCQKNCLDIKSQFLLSYDTTQQNFEDLMADIRVPISKVLRVRFSYEYYRPELKQNPGFREQFFSYYSLGSQKMMRSRLDYEFNPELKGFVEVIHSRREIGDNGKGIHFGLEKKNILPDLDTSIALDSLQLGEDKLASLYLSFDYAINSRLNTRWDAIVRREEKFNRENNRVMGVYGELNYMIKNNLLLAVQLKNIHYSRLRDEYMLRLEVSYYFDPFQPKEHRHPSVSQELDYDG